MIAIQVELFKQNLCTINIKGHKSSAIKIRFNIIKFVTINHDEVQRKWSSHK
jgi:hypothetical protein